MSSLKQVVGSCALALCVLLGMAGTGAAEPVGQTGKTVQQCSDDLALCLGATCPPLQSISVDLYNQCVAGCAQTYALCLPTKTRSTSPVGLKLLVQGQVAILESLANISAQLGSLRTQVGAALPADLLPMPSPVSAGPPTFCQLSPDLTKLQVHVLNQGTAGSVASTVRVDFANNAGVDMPAPPLAPGASAIVEFPIPVSCYDASNICHFTIVVDATNVVIESNETNNTASGLCGGSIF
ncbi:MAG TPA: CARDB domain-containing protein [Candidatus Binatia bacterium]|nr:CARDB domain-containing protein [Candidatus Binatia bacterium]